MWCGYFLLVAVIERYLVLQAPLPTDYYVSYGGAMIVLLALAYMPVLPDKLGRVYPALVLGIMGLLPIVVTYLVLPSLSWFPLVTLPTVPAVVIRHLPPVLLATLLVAWFGRWQHVLIFAVITTTVDIVLMLGYVPTAARMPTAVTMLMMGAVVFAFGILINRLAERLRQQQTLLEETNAQLQDYANARDDLIISRERNRLARDLHDTLAHALSGLIVQLEAANAYWDVEPDIARDLLEQSVETARSGLQETRRAIKALRSQQLEDLGLALAVKSLAETAAERAAFDLTLDIPQQLPHIEDDVEQCIYRVAQEGIANVVHHAQAQHLDLYMVSANESILLSIEDDGMGFAPQNVINGHFGVPGMKERARLVGGELEINSQPGRGTTVTLRVPQGTP